MWGWHVDGCWLSCSRSIMPKRLEQPWVQCWGEGSIGKAQQGDFVLRGEKRLEQRLDVFAFLIPVGGAVALLFMDVVLPLVPPNLGTFADLQNYSWILARTLALICEGPCHGYSAHRGASFGTILFGAQLAQATLPFLSLSFCLRALHLLFLVSQVLHPKYLWADTFLSFWSLLKCCLCRVPSWFTLLNFPINTPPLPNQHCPCQGPTVFSVKGQPGSKYSRCVGHMVGV